MAKKTAAAPKSRKLRAPRTAPTHEEVALRAYHIYLARTGAPGSQFEDWTRAERELLEDSAKPKSRRKSNVVSIAA